jgi:uncharacterized protein YegP (UPF0339 family)
MTSEYTVLGEPLTAPGEEEDVEAQVLHIDGKGGITRLTTLYKYRQDVGSLVQMASLDEGYQLTIPGTEHAQLGAPEYVTTTLLPGDRLNAAQGAVVYYEAKDGWRWRLRAPNGKVIADSAEAYTEKRGATEGFGLVVSYILGHLKVIEE